MLGGFPRAHFRLCRAPDVLTYLPHGKMHARRRLLLLDIQVYRMSVSMKNAIVIGGARAIEVAVIMTSDSLQVSVFVKENYHAVMVLLPLRQI